MSSCLPSRRCQTAVTSMLSRRQNGKDATRHALHCNPLDANAQKDIYLILKSLNRGLQLELGFRIWVRFLGIIENTLSFRGSVCLDQFYQIIGAPLAFSTFFARFARSEVGKIT